MIEYKIINPSFFLRTIKSLSNICYETNFIFGKGIRINAMDPSKICIFNMKFGNDVIEIIKDEKIEVGIDLESVKKVVNRFSKPEYLLLSYDNDERKLVFKGKIANKTKTFKLSAINTEVPDIGIDVPAMGYLTTFKIFANDLLEAVKDCEIYTEEVTILTKNDKIFVIGFGSKGEAEIKIESESEDIENDAAKFSVEFLIKLLDVMGKKQITILLKNERPLFVNYRISNKSYMRFFLAPRVTQPDDFLQDDEL